MRVCDRRGAEGFVLLAVLGCMLLVSGFILAWFNSPLPDGVG